MVEDFDRLLGELNALRLRCQATDSFEGETAGCERVAEGRERVALRTELEMRSDHIRALISPRFGRASGDADAHTPHQQPVE